MARIQVNGEVLRWARESAGLSLDVAAQKLQIRKSRRGASPDERLEALESGLEQPTRPLLLKMSKQYRRPLLAFYLETPPIKGSRGEDFRRLPEDYVQANAGLVDALIRDVRARQSIVRAALEDEDEARILPYVGSATLQDGVERVCQLVRQDIQFDLQTFRAQRTVEDAFAYLRDRAETAGIFVLIIGDLGSHHTKIALEEFRGFSLADPVAPFVIINDQDSHAAWSFTLLHELTHIWLGQTGISGAIAETAIERFCNDVAGAILLPIAELRDLNVSDATAFEAAIDQINDFARARNISRAMVAYNLLRLGVISQKTWATFRAEFRRQWLSRREAQRRKAQEQEGGVSYYVVRRHRVGRALLEFVSHMTSAGALTFTKAGKVLGVRARNVYELLQQAG